MARRAQEVMEEKHSRGEQTVMDESYSSGC
jgi:hypothetical protein